jgi:molybdenum transport protein
MSLPVLNDSLLEAFLQDDAPFGDLTTHVLGIDTMPGRIAFAARDRMVVACVEEAARMLELAGARVSAAIASGSELAAGAPILDATGPAGALHRAWKISQTLVEYASGIATAARRIVEAARAARPDVGIVCTRKNMPGAKALAIKSILAGGAMPHRLGLSETILIFAEHRVFFGGRTAAAMIAQARRGAPEKKIVVEVSAIDEAVTWAEAGADVLQTEKLSVDDVSALANRLAALATRPLLAAAGGINARNAAAYAAAGADILVTSAPYSAPPLDVAVRIEPAG